MKQGQCCASKSVVEAKLRKVRCWFSVAAFSKVVRRFGKVRECVSIRNVTKDKVVVLLC